MDQVLKLDMKEYRLLCEGKRLSNIDQLYLIHLSAFANNKATLRDKKGRLIYRSFDKFFDYEKALKGNDKSRKEESPQIKAYREYLKRMKGEGK